MKQLFTLLLLVISFTTFAQNTEVSGDYERRYETKEGDVLTYKITLNTDNTFEFHHLKKLTCVSCKEENFYGKGTWSVNKKLISLSSNSSLLNNKYDLNLDGSNARFITKSPRDKSNREIKTRIQFYNPGKLSWLKGKELFKIK